VTTKPDIAIGQIWRDKDKRREREGTVRTFEVVSVGDETITVHVYHPDEVELDYQAHFKRARFGSGRANDSFERVS
jgi:hypothetical protein